MFTRVLEPDHHRIVPHANENYAFASGSLWKRTSGRSEVFLLKDKSLEDSDDLPDLNVLAQKIADDLQTALDKFSSIVEGLKE